MAKRIFLFPAISLLLSILLSACASAPTITTAAATGTSAQSQVSTTAASTTATTGTTAKPTTQQTTAGTTKTSSAAFEKLDVLTSYHIVMTMEALDGPAVGSVQKYDARHLPQDKAYDSVRYMAQSGKDFVLAEELIVIGDSKWNKQAGKSWVVGASSTAAGHITELTAIYIGLTGKLEKIDEPTIGGLQTIHYAFLYEKLGNLRIKGEIWIARQSGLPAVPIKCFGEQSGIDDKGAVIADYRHLKFAFDVSEINAALSIKPPM